MRHSWRDVLSALVALSLAVPACAAPVDGETAAARKEDLEFLYQTLERAHPDLFANTPEERFLERKAAIETGLEEADDFTFALELQSLTALAGDSHTTLALGGSMSQTVHYYPMSLLHRDGRWYLSAAPTERRALLGREVTAVNGRSMEETVEAFGAVLSADNGVKLRRQYRQVCNVADYYAYLGLAKAGEPLALTLADGKTVSIAPMPYLSLGEAEIVQLGAEVPQPATARQKCNYCALPLSGQVYYIQYNVCQEDPALPMEDFAAQVQADLEAGGYSRVLVDLRNNGGGSDGVIWPLLRVLRQAMDRGMEGVEPLEPDVTVPQTMADTLAGRDTAVEWFLPALRWARESGAASGTGEAVQWACAAGLMEIDQGHFRPEEGLTRQEGEAAVERLAALAG